MDDEKRILENEFDNVIYLPSDQFGGSLIGVSDDNRAIYDFQLMVESLMKNQEMTEQEALDWIDYNTRGSLNFDGCPIILNRFIDVEISVG